METTIKYEDAVIRTCGLDLNRNGERLTVDLVDNFYEWKIKPWTPKNPNLYDVEFRLYDGAILIDEVYS